eukprot:scaffold258809_cov25-Tisochrysis_lutea.AAC.2
MPNPLTRRSPPPTERSGIAGMNEARLNSASDVSESGDGRSAVGDREDVLCYRRPANDATGTIEAEQEERVRNEEQARTECARFVHLDGRIGNPSRRWGKLCRAKWSRARHARRDTVGGACAQYGSPRTPPMQAPESAHAHLRDSVPRTEHCLVDLRPPGRQHEGTRSARFVYAVPILGGERLGLRTKHKVDRTHTADVARVQPPGRETARTTPSKEGRQSRPVTRRVDRTAAWKCEAMKSGLEMLARKRAIGPGGVGGETPSEARVFDGGKDGGIPTKGDCCGWPVLPPSGGGAIGEGRSPTRASSGPGFGFGGREGGCGSW